MIIISRMRGEAIVIGDCIVVQVVEIRDDKVRLGVESPKDMPVHRGGLVQALGGAATAPQAER